MHSVIFLLELAYGSLAFITLSCYVHLFLYLIFLFIHLITFIMSNNVFGNFVSSAPQSRQLPEGTHGVYVHSVEQTNSFLNGDGTEKADACLLYTSPSPRDG